jgi:hypothetical protein
MTTEIPSDRWEQFFRELNEMPEAMVTIHESDSNGRTRVTAENVPLVALTFQKQKDSCSDLVSIETGPPNQRPTQHQILEPIRFVLRADATSERFDRLEILAETGTTQITFRPGIPAAVVNQLPARAN